MDRPRTRRRAEQLSLLLALAALITAAALGTRATAAGRSPTPQLGISWTVVEHRCWTASERIRVRHGKTIGVRRRRVRRCGERPVRSDSSTLHLTWRQHGALFGHLTLAGKPIAGAPVTLLYSILNWRTGGETLTTNAQGRFSSPIYGPVNVIALAYQPPGSGLVIAVAKRVHATSYLSLHVGRLTAGHTALFHGVLYGGYIPQNLYVQYWYYAGARGWQPFSHLAIVNPATGRWGTLIPFPPPRHRRLHLPGPRHRRALPRLAMGIHHQRDRRPVRLLTEREPAGYKSQAARCLGRCRSTQPQSAGSPN